MNTSTKQPQLINPDIYLKLTKEMKKKNNSYSENLFEWLGDSYNLYIKPNLNIVI